MLVVCIIHDKPSNPTSPITHNKPNNPSGPITHNENIINTSSLLDFLALH